MTKKLITYDRAKSEIERLQAYVEMIDNFAINDFEDWVIYNYAITNSMTKIVKKATDENVLIDGRPIETADLSEIINGKTKTELHRILRLGYRQRIRKSKKWLLG